MKQARTFLICVCLAAFVFPAKAQGPNFTLHRLAEGIYAAVKEERIPRVFTCNVTVIINAHDVVVIDADGWPSAARALIAKIQTLTDKPVRTLVITHGAPDHVQTVYLWQRAYPGLEIVAQKETPALIKEVSYPYVTGQQERLQREILNLEKDLERRARIEGSSFPESVRDRMRRHLQWMRSYQSDLAEVEIVYPTSVFSDHVTLHRGSREIHLLYPGGGHTLGDVAVYLPKEKILISGDLVMSDRPFTAIASTVRYRNSLRELLKLDFDVLVPGHGPLLHGKDYLKLTFELADSILSRVRQALRRGLTLEETKRAIVLEGLRSRFAELGPGFVSQFDRQVPSGIENTYKELAASGKH